MSCERQIASSELGRGNRERGTGEHRPLAGAHVGGGSVIRGRGLARLRDWARARIPAGEGARSESRSSRQPEHPRLFGVHIAEPETHVVTEGHGRTVREWRSKPSKPDNHWLDCLVGCAVAASIQAVVVTGTDAKLPPRPRLRLSELQRSKR